MLIMSVVGIVERLGRGLDDSEKLDLMDKIDDGDGTVEFEEFSTVFCGADTQAQQVSCSILIGN